MTTRHLFVAAVLAASGAFADIVTGAPTLVGPLSKEEIASTIKRNLAPIRACLEKASPGAQGTVAVRFTIAASGEVSEATVTEQTVKDDGLAACVVGVVKTSKFPKPRGGGQVVVTWPFVFKR